jgi:hypothetical protein
VIIDRSFLIATEKGEPFVKFSLVSMLIHRTAKLLTKIDGNRYCQKLELHEL